MQHPSPELTRRHHQNLLLGASCIVLAELAFASMAASIRVVAEELPNEVIVFSRNVLGLLVLLPWFLHRGTSSFRTRALHLHLLRGTAGVGAMYCFFYAIAHVPLATAMLLMVTAPLFIPFIAWLWLKEPVTLAVFAAVAVGLVGVALILHPDLGGLSHPALIALLGGLFAAIAKVTVRRLSYTEPPSLTVFYFALSGTLVSLAPVSSTWQIPSAATVPWLLAIALLATASQLLLTRGLSLAPASQLGPFGYFSVVFGALFGWLFWHEILSWPTLAGFALVILAGSLTSRNESTPRSTIAFT